MVQSPDCQKSEDPQTQMSEVQKSWWSEVWSPEVQIPEVGQMARFLDDYDWKNGVANATPATPLMSSLDYSLRFIGALLRNFRF